MAPETPILDQLQEIPISPVLPDESQLVVLIRTCICVSGFLAVFALNCYGGRSGIVATIGALFVARYFCIGVHELGHLLAGIFLGRRCQLFAIGPACLFRQGSRWRFQLARNPSRLAGRINMPPSRPGSSLAKEFIFVAAGPGANAFLFAACLALRHLIRVGSPFWLWPVAILSVAMMIDSLIPLRDAEIRSDGARIISLLRGDGVADCIIADLSGRLTRGERPRCWDRSLIERATQAARQPIQHVSGNWFGYLRARDCGGRGAAARHLECALAHCYDTSSQLRQELFCEAAFVQARYRNQMELAKAWFARAEQLRLERGPQNSVSPNAVLLALSDRMARRQ